MNRMKLMVLALGVIALPAVSRAQQPDTIKKVDSVKADTARKKAADTTLEHNAKVMGKRTADNAKQGFKDTKSDVAKIANKAAKATKTNAKHLKENVKKATADTIHLPPKPDSLKAKPDSTSR
jgi:hypothetical protein